MQIAPFSYGAAARPNASPSGHFAVNAACRTRPSARVSARAGSVAEVECSAASTHRPKIFTCPVGVSSTVSGCRRTWASPAACANANASAASVIICWAFIGSSGPSWASTSDSGRASGSHS